MWLLWNHAALFAVLALAISWRARGWLRATTHELALVLSLYSVWRLAGELADRHADGAIENARALFRFQQSLQLPSELTVQQQVLDHPLVVQALNGYYAVAHVPGVVLVLVWLFFRHRDQYSWVRNALALVTAACLFLHFIPLAPPRLLPDLGFVDTGVLYGQSVYGSVGAHGLSNQVAAIPSVHMAWALLVAWGALAATRSRWRWLVVAHPVLTLWAIVATGNHWWLDAVSAAALLAVAVLVLRSLPEVPTRDM